MTKQVEKRTAAERREYFRQYHERRRLGKAAPAPVQMPRCSPGLTVFHFREYAPARYLRDGSGTLQWPERRRDQPESLEQTLRRVS